MWVEIKAKIDTNWFGDGFFVVAGENLLIKQNEILKIATMNFEKKCFIFYGTPGVPKISLSDQGDRKSVV